MSLVRVVAATTGGQWLVTIVATTALCILLGLFFTWAGGWRELASVYRTAEPYTGRRWRLAWASMRGSMGFGSRSPWCCLLYTSPSPRD